MGRYGSPVADIQLRQDHGRPARYSVVRTGDSIRVHS